MDRILKFENLPEDYLELRKHLPGLSSELPMLNASIRKREIPASSSSIIKVRKFYSKDYHLFYPRD